MRIRAYADLHLFVNKFDMDRYIQEELEDIKTNLINDPIDLLVFCGDLTHIPYRSDDIRFINTIKFITDIVDICRKKNILFRIIQGTSTHDGKIINILEKIFKNESHVKCFTSLAYEDLNGLVIRYLPEPYFDTYANFKEYAFDRKADITFFHGTISGLLPVIRQLDNVTNLPKSIVIDRYDLINNTNLFSAGGHIHKHINIDNKIFYINSLTTHNFSDINNIKGYMEFIIYGNKRWNYKYIENDKAPKYLEYKIENIHNKLKEDIKKIAGNIMLLNGPRDHLRFTITGLLNRNSTSNVAYLRTILKRYDVKIITKYEEAKSIKHEEEYGDFFMDPSIDISKKIHKIIELDYNNKISIDRVKELINKNE